MAEEIPEELDGTSKEVEEFSVETDAFTSDEESSEKSDTDNVLDESPDLDLDEVDSDNDSDELDFGDNSNVVEHGRIETLQENDLESEFFEETMGKIKEASKKT